MAPAISARGRVRNIQLRGGYVRIRTLSGANFTLVPHFLGQMTLSMQNFRHFWLNVQDFVLAGLAPKLRRITSIRKKHKNHNEVGYLEQVSDLTSGQPCWLIDFNHLYFENMSKNI